MKVRTFAHIVRSERYFNSIRWSPDDPWRERDLEYLRELRTEIIETVSSLDSWSEGEKDERRRTRALVLKNMLVDFNWDITTFIQIKEHEASIIRRIWAFFNPPVPLSSKDDKAIELEREEFERMKGGSFYKDIPSVFDPVARGGR